MQHFASREGPSLNMEHSTPKYVMSQEIRDGWQS